MFLRFVIHINFTSGLIFADHTLTKTNYSPQMDIVKYQYSKTISKGWLKRYKI